MLSKVPILLAIVLLAQTAAATHSAFYFAAHPDDWQLFMNPDAYNHVQDFQKTKVIFVHLTAGDAGVGLGTKGQKFPFYLARENGATQAIRFMVDSTNGWPGTLLEDHVVVHGHRLYRQAYGNTVNYFFRLPDGNNWTGEGYEGTGFQSLLKLKKGAISALNAIDGSSSYQSWTDLTQTLGELIQNEKADSKTVSLHVAELDQVLNPRDHPDHIITAEAAVSSVHLMPCISKVFYVEYQTSSLPENLTATEREKESAVFAVTCSGITALDHRSSWDYTHRSWLGRNYSRTVTGIGECVP